MRTHVAVRVDDEISLVPRRGDDAGEMYAVIHRHRDDLRQWLPWVDATQTLGDVRRYAQFARAQGESGVAFDYVIRSGGALVGSIGVYGFDWASQLAQLGYWLSPDARGRGIMTRAVSSLLTRALTDLELHRIEIRCVVENERSRAIPERLALTCEGILHEAYRLHDRYRDIALYAAIAGRWPRPGS